LFVIIFNFFLSLDAMKNLLRIRSAVGIQLISSVDAILTLCLKKPFFARSKQKGSAHKPLRKVKVNSFSTELKPSEVRKKVEITSANMFYDGTWHRNQFFSCPLLALLGGIFFETTLTAATFPSGPLTGLKVRKKY